MKISALASGSSGNCFYVENEKKNQSILVDCGISCKQVEERLSFIKRSPEKIKAIFLTHEHSDHIRGVDVFARKFQIPVFAPKKMIHEAFLCSDSDLLNGIKNNETMKIAGLHVSAFPKSHKALDPVSYNLIKDNKKLSIMTDVGYACENIIDNVSDSNFLCMESNYDEKMLMDGSYPWPTKQWIKSDVGHLSNVQSAACVLEHGHKKLKNIMLCHISQNNNTPEKAMETYSYFMKQRLDMTPKIDISTRQFATPLFRV
jgi:phosphoribosyl 1,2-cyclic phosphodiesterase